MRPKTALTNRRALWFIIVAGVLARLIAAAALGDEVRPLPGIFDQISYHTLAQRVLSGHGFTFAEAWWPGTPAGEPTAHWSYLYTLWLAGIYALAGPHPVVPRVLQAILAGTMMPYLTFRLARRAFPAGHNGNSLNLAALLAAAWSALYIYFIYYAAALVTEALYMIGALWVLDCALRISLPPVRSSGSPAAGLAGANQRLWLELGLAVGLTAMLRQVFLLFAPVLFGWLAWSIWRRANRLDLAQPRVLGRILRGGLLAGAALAALILPITAFNYTRFGRVVLLNTNAGFAFFWANHPVYGDHFVPILTEGMPDYQALIPTDIQTLNEAARDSALLQRGLGFVVADPGRYVRLSLSRIPVFFMFWLAPQSGRLSNLARVGSFAVALPFMLAGIGLWLFTMLRPRGPHRQAAGGVLLLLFAGVYSLLHLLSWALIRYRLPVDAVLLVFAGHALAVCWQWLRQPRLAHAREPVTK